MTREEARENYELADSELVYWTRRLLTSNEGSKAERVSFQRMDISASRREEALAELLRSENEQ